MKTKQLLSVFLLAFTLTSFNVFSQEKNIVEVAVSSDAHTTLVAAVKAADLVGVLTSEGPFTVFAPTNDAFSKLPAGTVETLLKPENISKLQAILKYHVVSGNFMASDVVALINKNNGMATIPTVNGSSLTAMIKDGSVFLKDVNGNMSKISATDLKASNGVIHVIDSVVLPK